MKNTSTSLHEAIALRRLSLVQQIIELIQQLDSGSFMPRPPDREPLKQRDNVGPAWG